MSKSQSKDGPVWEKYEVRRMDGRDGPGLKHDGCAHFVLDLTHDPYAVVALEAYSKACAEELRTLSNDTAKMAKHWRREQEQEQVIQTTVKPCCDEWLRSEQKLHSMDCPAHSRHATIEPKKS